MRRKQYFPTSELIQEPLPLKPRILVRKIGRFSGMQKWIYKKNRPSTENPVKIRRRAFSKSIFCVLLKRPIFLLKFLGRGSYMTSNHYPESLARHQARQNLSPRFSRDNFRLAITLTQIVP